MEVLKKKASKLHAGQKIERSYRCEKSRSKQVKNQKVLVGDYTLMKILKILYQLSLQPLRMLEQLWLKLNESTNHLREKYKFSQLGSKERKLWVRARWLAYLKEVRMRSEKRRKFNGKSYRVSDLKEGPYKKKLS